jgi:hypothetical protein
MIPQSHSKTGNTFTPSLINIYFDIIEHWENTYHKDIWTKKEKERITSGGRKLHNNHFQNLYSSLNIIMVIKSRRVMSRTRYYTRLVSSGQQMSVKQ